MATTLFDDFNSISSKQWKQKIQFELDGAEYNQTVIWNSPEDIQVKPFYHRDEFSKTADVKTEASNFKICQNIFVYDIEKSIQRAVNTIERGAETKK
jgi:methylmalonyl-CoA mutase